MVVTDNLPPDSNPIAGLFAVSGLQFGIYTLQETIPVPGYDLDPFVETFMLTNTDPNQEAEHIFLNTWAKRAFLGSTVVLRVAHLDEIAMREAASVPVAQTSNTQVPVAQATAKAQTPILSSVTNCSQPRPPLQRQW